jgi:pyruvate kinase
VHRSHLKAFKMKTERGLPFPRGELQLEPPRADDLTDLDFVAAHADIARFSFVPCADDITRMQDEPARRHPDWQQLGIVAKIETAQAATNLPYIIVGAADR